ncbi:hypothetical protein [Desulfitobacterium hafniense]|uniref:hypothetical protein n=1 Tax=Desulfitobacterium hafniense TaxID=49338 RepID=UPI00059B5A77|nr:hypothetical protein [Desulfitobacterium hafniense]
MVTTSVSYKQALAPQQQAVMHKFLKDLCGVYDMGKDRGMGKPDINSFLEAYRQPRTDRRTIIDKRKREKDLYEAKKAAGICVKCPNKPVPGLLVCQSCRDKNRMRRGGKTC